MLSAAEVILLFVATTEAVLGLLGNAFILLVNCTDWVRNKKLSKIGFILTGLAISRIFTIWIITLDAFANVFFGDMLMSSDLSECISYLWVIINHLSVWFGTSLSVFYFLKIANFSHYIFLWLKKRSDKVFTFLIGCLIITWLASLPPTAKVIKHVKMHHSNTSCLIHHLDKSDLLISYFFPNTGVIFLFVMALTACFLLIISLWRHNKQMQSHVSRFRDLNTEAHVKAMKVLISFIILFILYFAGIFTETLCLFLKEKKIIFLFGFIMSSLYPCCHSFILILTSSQLKQTSVRVLKGLKCCET
ncbi:taste receptor type 2 member 104 [Phodopus roborovskii]|uniref:Taste receptor type 2 n=1 Tax=Phodopus roborovskii TaxID=109678 RepID=A0AAV0AB44_PHORO|nr:taste receptor type 2 member 104 [Phodopus roborovskii]CAH7425520.1 Tas2r104 [Phodopus roborovskii]